MRCYICDVQLTDKEVSYNKDHEDWDPCTGCLLEINDVFDDGLDEDEISSALELEWGFSDVEDLVQGDDNLMNYNDSVNSA